MVLPSKKFWLYFLACVFIVLLGSYFLVTSIVEPSLERYVSQNLPDAMKTKDISFHLMPLSVNLGVDAAVLTTIGLPAYLGDKVVEKVTGVSLIKKAQQTFSSVFKASEQAQNPPTVKDKPKTKTAIPTRKNR